jgi:hypothetical protein
MYSFRFFFYLAIVVCVVLAATEWSTRHQRKYTKQTKTYFNELLDQAARLTVQSSQDQNELISYTHIVEAGTIMQTLIKLAPEEDLQTLLGVKYQEIVDQIQKQKSKASSNLLLTCPNLSPQHALSSIAGWYPPV